MTMELENGKEVISEHMMGNVDFELGTKTKSTFFRNLQIGLYGGILGMGWLIAIYSSIHCVQGSLTFQDTLRQEILVQGKKWKTHGLSSKG